MKQFLFILLVALAACHQKADQQTSQAATDTAVAQQPAVQAEAAPVENPADTAVSTANYTKLASEKGDLDGDGVDEMAMIFDTPTNTEFGTQRAVHIYKQKGKEWALWHHSTGAVLPSQQGGTMGDPFQGISIDRGALVIRQMGGSNDKWEYVHRFRLEGGQWVLIGTTITFGTPCEGFERYDFNVLKGRINAEITTETCDENTDKKKVVKKSNFAFNYNLPKPVLMDGFKPGENEVKVPKDNKSFYF